MLSWNRKSSGTNLILEIIFWQILINFIEKDEEISKLRGDVDAKAQKISELKRDIAAARDSQLPAFRNEIDVLCTILEEIASIYHGAPDDGLGDALRGRDERIASLMKKIRMHGYSIASVEAGVLNKTSNQLSEKLGRFVSELDRWKKKEEEMARREIELENRLMDYQLPFRVPRREEEEIDQGSQMVALPRIPDRARSGRMAKDEIVKELEYQLKEARDELIR